MDVYKIIPSTPCKDWSRLVYKNTIRSFVNSMWFYLVQLKLPTLAITIPYSLVLTENDPLIKARMMVGAGLLNSSIYMIANKSGAFTSEKFKFLTNINSVMTNAFFLPIVWDGVYSKIMFLSCSEFNQLDLNFQKESRFLINVQLLAELFFSSTGSVAVFALMDLTSNHSSSLSTTLKSNLCLIKSGLFIIAQLLFKYHHHDFQQASDEVQDMFSKHVRNLLYENENEDYLYLDDFLFFKFIA